MDYSAFGNVPIEWDAFIAANPPAVMPPESDPLRLRKATNDVREQFSANAIKSITDVKAKDVTFKTSDGEEVSIRVYAPKSESAELLPVYLYYHGGGFLFGTISTEDAYCYTIVHTLKVLVLSVNYRHTPEWKFPIPQQDAWEALNWAIGNVKGLGGDPTKIVVGGTSAGGNLAAHVVLREKRELGKNRVMGQLLAIPWVCHPAVFPRELVSSVPSYEEMADAPVLPKERVKLFIDLLDVKPVDDIGFSSLFAKDSDVAGMVPTHFLIAGRDPLRDEALLYMEKLKKNGVQTSHDLYVGLPHGFRLFADYPTSKQYDIDTKKALKNLFKI